ncbi:MAG: CHAP domain-containing protein [Oscillospiraceae bacterium]|nr:CHAP domain-containing protein [Oscillospiraceae bacterium]
MARIKSKNTAKSGGNTVNNVLSAGERMRRAAIRTKSKVQRDSHTSEDTPEEYASNQVSQGAEGIAQEGMTQATHHVKRGLRSAKERVTKGMDSPSPQCDTGGSVYPSAPVPSGGSPQTGQVGSPRTAQHSPSRIQGSSADPGDLIPDNSPPRPTEQARQWGKKKAADRSRRSTKDIRRSIKTVDHPLREIKTIDREKRRIARTPKKAVKTAQHTAKATIKTTEQSAQASVKTAKLAAQTVQATAKTTAQGAKAAAKATVSAIKGIIAATRTLISAIIAGGWVALLVLVLICLIGLITASPFGVFFSGEDSDTGQTMQTAVREINEDYQAQIDAIKASTSYDALEMSGSCAAWREVLAVYAVKTTTESDNAQEVASMDDPKKAILRDLFWQMTDISSRTETDSSTETVMQDDGHGNMVETEVTTTFTTLYITVSHKTADEMAILLHFAPEQLAQLAELLAEENSRLWAAVLYGVGPGDRDIVAVALSQLGNVGGDPYWSWYGFDSHVDWCACFVSWCANECGYIDAGAIPKFASCSEGTVWFQNQELWQGNSYEPRPSDLIFFDWDDGGQDGSPDHVGIVEKVEGNTIYTVEGNSGDACREKNYTIGHYEIFGYGTPSY